MPVMLLKGLVILPNQEITIELNNELSRRIVKNASLKTEGQVLVVAPTDAKEENPSVDDLPRVGVIAKIKNKLILPNNAIRITLRGKKRFVVSKYYTLEDDEDILYCDLESIELPKFKPEDEMAVRRKLIDSLKEYINSAENISNSILNSLKETFDLAVITDMITSFLPFDVSKKLEYMQNINPLNRAMKLISDITEEKKYIELDNKIDEKVNEELEKSQIDFILKEKLKAIKSELGETSFQEEETARFKDKLSKLKLDKKVKEKIAHEIDKFEVMNESSPELSVLRNYLDWILNLPWNKKSLEQKDSKKVEKELNTSHYGLEKIKERIIEYVAIKNISPNINPPVLCLVGPPGVGKTTIAMSIAKSLNKEFYKISVGGLNDSTELIGSRRTYLASSPGKIIQGLKKCNSKNPVILIDEVDKMVKDYKGDPASTLLEILDSSQNKNFIDNYIEEPFDLSEVLFILTANDLWNIPLPILDRVELIELNSYTLFEKKDIAKKYLLPKIYKEYYLNQNKLKFTNDLLYFIVENYTLEAGVRELERVLSALVRKLIINNIKNINKEKVIKLLGNPKYSNDLVKEENYGVVNSLAVTSVGGMVSKIETVKVKGNGKLTVTGSVGNVMEESIQVALGYIQTKYNHNLSSYDLYIHFMDTETRKNGPSAGLSIITSILSCLNKEKIADDIAFTGEISLNGSVLKIGGLKEKLIGAYNKGIKTVYIPRSNADDLDNIPKLVLDNMEIILVENYQEIYTKLFK